MARELNKAYWLLPFPPPTPRSFSELIPSIPHSGFIHQETGPAKPIATGHWGCGAFQGSKPLKALLQVMAASEAHRPSITYFTFGESEFAADVQRLSEALRERGVTVGGLWNVLVDFWCSSGTVGEADSAESEQPPQEAPSGTETPPPVAGGTPLFQYVRDALLTSPSTGRLERFDSQDFVAAGESEETEPDLSPARNFTP